MFRWQIRYNINIRRCIPQKLPHSLKQSPYRRWVLNIRDSLLNLLSPLHLRGPRLPREAQVELLGSVPAAKVAGNIAVVVTHDCEENVTGADTVGALGLEEHAFLLHKVVDVVAVGGLPGSVDVRNGIVSYKINFVLVEKLLGYYPGCIWYNFVDPFAILN